MHNRKTALLTVVTACVLLTLGAFAMLAAASNRPSGSSPAQIDTSALMGHASNLPDQKIESLF